MTLTWEGDEYDVEGGASYDSGNGREGPPPSWELGDITVTDWEGHDVTDRMMAIPAFAAAAEDLILTDAQDARDYRGGEDD